MIHLVALHTLVVGSLLAGLAPEHPPARHAVAFINDQRSHGTVGDKLLSLNEVIQLHNRSLELAKLSKEERAQISGEGDIFWADIHPSRTKTITLERDLDVIGNHLHGLLIGGNAGLVTIQIGSTKGFRVESDFCDFHNLTLVGGDVAVTLTQRNAITGSLFANVVFQGQKVAGVDITLKDDDGSTELLFQDCEFVDARTAVQVNDLGRKRSGRVSFVRSRITGAENGLRVTLGQEGAYFVELVSLAIEKTRNGILFQRSKDASRGLTLHVADVQVTGAEQAFVLDGHPTAPVDARFQLVGLEGSKTALSLGSLGSLMKLLLRDSQLAGNVSVLAGKEVADLQNCRFSGGTVHLGKSAGTLTLSDSRLEQVTLATSGSAQLAILESCFLGGTIDGTAQAPVNGTRCHVRSTKVGTHATFKSSRPAPQLGRMDVTPPQPALGSKIRLQSDLPPGLLGYWAVGPAVAAPVSLAGVRIYLDPQAFVLATIPVGGRWQTQLKVPVRPALQGQTFAFQLFVGPDSQTAAPAFASPTPRQITVR